VFTGSPAFAGDDDRKVARLIIQIGIRSNYFYHKMGSQATNTIIYPLGDVEFLLMAIKLSFMRRNGRISALHAAVQSAFLSRAVSAILPKQSEDGVLK